MTAKIYLTGISTFIGTNILSAQSTAVLHNEQWKDFDITLLVGKLEQSALMILIGSVAFISLIWICSILKTCATLKKTAGNLRNPSMLLAILILGLSTFCGSCSAEQRAMAIEYRKAEAAEHRTCPLPHHYQEQVNAPYLNHNPYTGYSNLYGPSFCKYCGRRITR